MPNPKNPNQHPQEASMGPEHEGSGKCCATVAIMPAFLGFNGAGARGLRKMMVVGGVLEAGIQASMGPEHEGPGKSHRAQGHPLAGGASMGPEHEGSGKFNKALGGVPVSRASMGPEHEGSGK